MNLAAEDAGNLFKACSESNVARNEASNIKVGAHPPLHGPEVPSFVSKETLTATMTSHPPKKRFSDRFLARFRKNKSRASLSVPVPATPSSDDYDTDDTQVLREPLPYRDHIHNSDDERLWGKKTVLTFGELCSAWPQIWLTLCSDGGGVRGYASLLILKQIMIKIQELEYSTEHGSHSVEYSRSYPWSSHDNAESNGPVSHTESLDDFLPCHYFDYIAGTSTGGYV